jgi:hypothetical protein
MKAKFSLLFTSSNGKMAVKTQLAVQRERGACRERRVVFDVFSDTLSGQKRPISMKPRLQIHL